MAYTAISRTKVTKAGVRFDNIGSAGVAGGAGTGYKFSNDGTVLLFINNTSVNAPNCVVLASGTFKGVALTADNKTIAMASGTKYIAGPFEPEIFNDSAGMVNIYFSGSNETDLKVVPFNVI